MSISECLDAVREAVAHNLRVTDKLRAERAEANRRAALPHHDPGAIDMCPPPRSMGRDGCQLYRPLEPAGR
jgi:hypothetical protein